MRVNIGKDIELDVDVSRFNAAVVDHVMYIGLRNILMDSHAGDTREAHGDRYREEAEKTALDKLAAMYNGEIRVAGTRSSDPVKSQMRALAVAHAKKVLRASGRKFKDIKSEEITAEANKILAKNEEALRKVAEKMVKAAAALDVSVDL